MFTCIFESYICISNCLLYFLKDILGILVVWNKDPSIVKGENDFDCKIGIKDFRFIVQEFFFSSTQNICVVLD